MVGDRLLRFCMLTTFYPPYNFGGDGIFVQRLANQLAQRGHHVEVIHCIDAYKALTRKEPKQTSGDHPNVTVHGLKSRFGVLSPLATQQTGFLLVKSRPIQHILAQGFDVIHYHNISLLGPKILTYGHGIKLYTMHEYWLMCPTHILFRFNSAVCENPHCLVCTLVHKRPPQWWRYFPRWEAALKHEDAFIAPSQFSKERHHHWGRVHPLVHLPSFVPSTETAWPAPVEDEDREQPYFLFVGRLEKQKGVQTLFPVFRQERRARLLIAGTGTDELQLRRLAEGTPNIRFLGYRSGAQLRLLYQRALALIVPSLCLEVFPLVVLEAFQQRTPAIVRNIGGLSELINESGGGLIYTSETELIAAMNRIRTDPSYRDTVGEQGYEAYQRLWTTDAHLQRYFALIEEIAATRGLSLRH